MQSSKFNLLIATLVMGAVTVLAAPHAQAITTVFQGDLAGFNAAAGSPAISIDFDSIAPGTNIAGSIINGVTFISPLSGNSLDVVIGASTFTPCCAPGDTDNRLFATSGVNVLSPGGTALVAGNAPAERDSLRLDSQHYTQVTKAL